MRRTRHLMVWTFVLAAALSAGCKSAWVSSGLIYREQQGDYAKAEEMFKRALWFNDNEAIAHYELAYTLAYRAENDHLANGEVDSARIKISQAFEHYLRAAELDPGTYRDNPDAEDEADRNLSETGIASMYARMYNRGVQLMGSDRVDEAITYFELAALADPRGARQFEPKLLIAKLEFNAAADDEAAMRNVLADLEALKVDNSWEDAAAMRTDLTETKARVYRTLGDEAKAAELYEELLAQSPGDVSLMQQVAEIKSNSGDYAGAGALFQQSLETAIGRPQDFDDSQYFSFAYRALLAYREAEMYPQAIAMADKAMLYSTSNNERSQVARAKARAFYELEQFEEAVTTIEPVVRDGGFDPTSVEAWQIYYLSLNRVGRTQEAVTARERFIALRDGTGR